MTAPVNENAMSSAFGIAPIPNVVRSAFRRDLRLRIALAAMALAVSFLLGVGVVTYGVIRSHIHAAFQSSLKHEAAMRAEHASGLLRGVAATMNSLAKNDVLATGLVDSAGRESYLVPFLEGFRTVEGVPVELTVTDFEGRPILGDAGGVFASNSAWVERAAQAGEAGAVIASTRAGQHLLASAAMVYERTGSTEGMLVYSLPLQGLLEVNPRKSEWPLEVRLVRVGSSVEAREPMAAIGAAVLADRREIVGARALLELPGAFAPLGLAVEVRAPVELMAGPLNRLTMAYLVIGGLALVMLLALSLAAADRLTRRLREFEATVASVIDVGSLDQRIEARGEDEIARLGLAFNAMLNRLTHTFERLRQRTHQLGVVLESMPDSVFTLDAQGGHAVVIREIKRTLGTDEAAHREESAKEALPDRSDPVLLGTVRRALDTGGLQVVEYARTGADGERQFEGRVLALPEGFGPNPMTIWLARDITERKRAEEALRSSEALIRQITDALPVCILYVDAGQRTRFANRTMAEWYARPFADIIGHTIEEVVGSARYGKIHRRVESVLSGRQVDVEDEFAFPDGITRRVAITYVPDTRPDGAVQGFFALIEDITQRVLMEEQLRQSQKMEAVGQLTGGVAHDFNNLLTVILGNVQLLGKKLEGNDDLARRVSTIERAAQRGAALTRQLLAFSRRQELSPEVVDLNAIIVEMRDLLTTTLGETFELRILAHEGVWLALIDRSQVENAILNLCVNARDAMPRGGRLVIETDNVTLDQAYAVRHVEVAAGDYVMVAVTDTGTGMPPEVVARVFEPFFTTKETGKGTGLGLSMVYGFVKQSGGHAKVYSEVGHGTTVKLYFPRTSHEAAAADSDEADTAQDSDDRIVILAVEDDEDVRETAVALLESMGHRVITADDGRAALAVLASGTPIDLLFTDVVMPGGMLGTELAEQARSRWPHLKVLFTSGYTRRAMHDNGKLPEGSHMIAKPYAAADLASKIMEVMLHGSK